MSSSNIHWNLSGLVFSILYSTVLVLHLFLGSKRYVILIAEIIYPMYLLGLNIHLFLNSRLIVTLKSCIIFFKDSA